MNAKTSSMLERLQEFLDSNPKDSFVRYGLAMELSKLGRTDEAVRNFRQLMQDDPDYVAAYQQAGLVLLNEGRREEAKEAFRNGMAAALRKGDTHAFAELQEALTQLS